MRAGNPRLCLHMVFCVVALAFTTQTLRAQNRIVPDSQAAQFVGQSVTVEGVVVQVSTSPRSNTTFLNFGARYPNHIFNAVIFRSAAAQFPNPQQWEGKRVRVTGTVRLYQGKPEIVLETGVQLTTAPQ